MVTLVRDYFDTWQTIATRKEVYDQVMKEQGLSHTAMLPIFTALAYMVTMEELSFNPIGYYGKNW